MKFLFIFEQIRAKVATCSEFRSLRVYWVHPHVPSLTTPPPSPHNRVQNKHIKIFQRYRVLYLCTVQRTLKTHWDSCGLDWARNGERAPSVTLQSNWASLCWRVNAVQLEKVCAFCVLHACAKVTF